MKTRLFSPTILLILIIFSSCGVSTSLMVNQNQNTTQVQLKENNYKVIERVSGSVEVPYVLFIGGMKEKQQYASAYSAMLNKANLSNGSRALVNIVTEEHFGGLFPIFFKKTVTVSAHVIEFTK